MTRVISLTLPAFLLGLAVGCSGSGTGSDASGGTDSGGLGTDSGSSGTDSGNSGVDSGSMPPDASAGPDASSAGDSGSPDGGACLSQLGSCDPCPGWTGNDAGLGAYCSSGGNQCMNGTYCPADFGQNQNYCVSVGACDSDAGTGCGPGECCKVENNPFGGTVVVCLPAGCFVGGC